jgi:succinate-semialdehyde dehydrogenase/glutarate-semialdehyde dehydrogenase
MSKYRVQNPATGKLLETFESASDSGIERALAEADDAHREWRARSVQERARVIQRVADIFGERRGELARLIALEMGKSITESEDEVDFARSILEYYAVHGPSLITDYEIPSTIPGKAVVEHRPIGALLGVMPWNFPYYQVARFAAPNLVLGNTILLKHADICARSALTVEEIMRAAGVPRGGYQNVFASHAQIATMIGDSRVQGVSLTGSERAGEIIGEQAGRHLKKCVLELGGIDPMVVLDADDVVAVAKTAWDFRVYNAGQVCTRTSA